MVFSDIFLSLFSYRPSSKSDTLILCGRGTNKETHTAGGSRYTTKSFCFRHELAKREFDRACLCIGYHKCKESDSRSRLSCNLELVATNEKQTRYLGIPEWATVLQQKVTAWAICLLGRVLHRFLIICRGYCLPVNKRRWQITKLGS